MLMVVTSWELGVLRVPLIMVPDKFICILTKNIGQSYILETVSLS
jgi:hypothetical protein